MDPNYAQHSDSRIWSDFRQGSQEAFAYLYHTYYRKLYNYGYRLIPDKELLKDNLQELFLELWRDREKLGEARNIQVYLLVSFRRKLFGKIRTLRKQFTDTGTELLAEDSFETHLIHAEADTEQKQRLSKELEELPKRQKEAIYLRYYQELTYGQITEIMNLQYQTVRDLIYKGLKTLRRNLTSIFLLL